MQEFVVLALGRVVPFAVVALLAYALAKGLYNRLLHPLARFPGPLSNAVSNFSHCHRFLGGRQPYDLLRLHEKYGPVVRTAPSELSFNTAQSWKDIYDFRNRDYVFIKSDFYENGSFADQCGSIVSERDPEKHANMRKYLAPAFSQRSLLEQEALVADLIDDFIVKIGELGKTAGGVDLSAWLNVMTFDIIGELAFAQSFDGIKTGTVHPWIKRMMDALTKGALVDTFKRFPLVAVIVMTLSPGPIKRAMDDVKTNENMSIDLVKKRIATKQTSRKDFFTAILASRESTGVSDIQMAAHASDFVLAGSETSATALACITYYLCRTPRVLHALRSEIDAAFASYDAIDARSTNALRYLHAVILEGLRMYPPLPFALPRSVPSGGAVVDGHFVPGGMVVSTAPVAACLAASNFKDPLEFMPERWLADGERDSLGASQPFSLGSRACLGQSLAWMELHTTLAKMVYSYEFELLKPDLDWHKESRMTTLWSRPSLPVRVSPRSH